MKLYAQWENYTITFGSDGLTTVSKQKSLRAICFFYMHQGQVFDKEILKNAIYLILIKQTK